MKMKRKGEEGESCDLYMHAGADEAVQSQSVIEPATRASLPNSVTDYNVTCHTPRWRDPDCRSLARPAISLIAEHTTRPSHPPFPFAVRLISLIVFVCRLCPPGSRLFSLK